MEGDAAALGEQCLIQPGLWPLHITGAPCYCQVQRKCWQVCHQALQNLKVRWLCPDKSRYNSYSISSCQHQTMKRSEVALDHLLAHNIAALMQ